ncbi:MAG: hypothetical protein EBZ49_04490 [Proteobacteria bacterium]|nr:hypothetical protein [Pseudomonadota bacterium]
MKLAKTDFDKLYDELFGLVLFSVDIAEKSDLPLSVKTSAITAMTDKTFASILKKIRSQRDRAVALSSN